MATYVVQPGAFPNPKYEGQEPVPRHHRPAIAVLEREERGRRREVAVDVEVVSEGVAGAEGVVASGEDDGGAVMDGGLGPGNSERDGLGAGGLFSEVGARDGQ